jgi:hypothetical protein
MFPVWQTFRKIFLWSYGRSTWQYDVLCALILAFIFLTPKNWFTGELKDASLHQNGSKAAETLLFWPENRNTNPDRQEIERRARIITGRQNLRVKAVHEKRDNSGEIVAYEVDIE